MKRLITLFLSAIALATAEAQTKMPLMVNTNGTLIAISAGGTTNFFYANYSQLTNALIAGGFSSGGGGGGGTSGIALVGGMGSNNVFYAPYTTNLTERATLTVLGAANFSGTNMTLSNPNGNSATLSLVGGAMGGTTQTISSSPAGLVLGSVQINGAAISANSLTLANNLGASNATFAASMNVTSNATVGGAATINGGITVSNAINLTNRVSPAINLYGTVTDGIFPYSNNTNTWELGFQPGAAFFQNEYSGNYDLILYSNDTSAFAGALTVASNLAALSFTGNGAGLTNVQANALPSALVSSVVYTNVYTNDLIAASADWQVEQGLSIAYAGGTNLFTSSGVFAHYSLTNHYTAANDYEVKFKIFVGYGGSFGFGIFAGVGANGNQPLPDTKFWQLDPTGVTNLLNWWHLNCLNATTFNYLDSTNFQSISYGYAPFTNAWLDVKYMQWHGAANLSISNESTAQVIRDNYAQAAAASGSALDSNYLYFGASGYPTVWAPVGTFTLTNFTFGLLKPTNYIFAAMVDSIGAGFSTGLAYAGWPVYAAQALGGDCEIYGRPGDNSSVMNLCSNDIAALNAPIWLNAIGGNDGAVTPYLNTNLAFLKSICSTVIDIGPTPRGFAGYATPFYLQTWDATNLTEVINPWSFLVGTNTGVGNAPANGVLLPGYQGDGPHPNAQAQQIIGAAVGSYLRTRTLP